MKKFSENTVVNSGFFLYLLTEIHRTFVTSKLNSMSRTIKSSALFIGIGIILFLFISSVTPNHPKPVDERKMVEMILAEYDNEMAYGNPNINVDAFVDQVLIESLKKNNQ